MPGSPEQASFSLILPTLGSVPEFNAFLNSLSTQGNVAVQVVVVDQSEGKMIAESLLPFGHLDLLRLAVGKPIGLSAARNLGLKHAMGDVVAFPDDDCTYPEMLLSRVQEILQTHSAWAGVSGRVVDPGGGVYARFDDFPGLLTPASVWQRTSSVSLFVRRKVVDIVGDFDEKLGLGSGSLWQGGEDIDYPLRACELCVAIGYDPQIVVHHAAPPQAGAEAIKRAYRYGLGIGRVWRKNHLPLWLAARYLARPLIGSILNILVLDRRRATYHWSAFKGRWRGWTSPYP